MHDLFDAHIHAEALPEVDLESLHFFGTVGALVTAHHSPNEAKPSQILAHFDDVVSVQLPRLERAGIRAYAALGMDPRCLPRRGLAEVLGALPGYFGKGRAIAIGEIGLHRGGPTEEHAFIEQLLVAKRLKLPVLVHTPRKDKAKITRRSLNILRDTGIAPGSVLVDHADGTTTKLIVECGHWAGLTLHPEELKPERAVALVRAQGSERLVFNTDSGDGAGDLTALARTASLLEKAQLSADFIDRVCFTNARDFLRLRSPLRRRAQPSGNS